MAKANIFVRTAASGAEGEGVAVNRLFPVQGFMNFDPFVLWDEFTIGPGAGFPDHPHRGFEGITYVMQGSVRHADNLGNNSTVYRGGLQRFTAGRGIIHSEMPSADGTTKGIQLWVNLPASLKKIEPSYQQISANEINIIDFKGGHVSQLCAENALLKLHTAVIYQDVELALNQVYSLDVGSEKRGFIYVLYGALVIAGQTVKQAQACFVEEMETVVIKASRDSRFMLCFGQAHHQSIYQHGSFVD